VYRHNGMLAHSVNGTGVGQTDTHTHTEGAALKWPRKGGLLTNS